MMQADRILGMSHGGEMAFEDRSEYTSCAPWWRTGRRDRVPQAKPDATAQIDPATGLLNVEKMLMREPEKLAPGLKTSPCSGSAPSNPSILVQGRDSDELQGIFRVCYDFFKEAGKEAWWASYDHDEHRFIYVRRNDDGVFVPISVQIKAVELDHVL